MTPSRTAPASRNSPPYSERSAAAVDRRSTARAHAIRYPTPATVCDHRRARPSLRRSFITVTRTTLVNGSMFSSQASPAAPRRETTAPPARSSSSSTANSLRDSGDVAAVPEHLAAVRVQADAGPLQHRRRRRRGPAGRAPAPGRPARRTRTAWPGSRRRRAPARRPGRRPSPAAVSMRIRAGRLARATTARHTSSPCTLRQVPVEHQHVVVVDVEPLQRARRRRRPRPRRAPRARSPSATARPAAARPRPPEPAPVHPVPYAGVTTAGQGPVRPLDACSSFIAAARSHWPVGHEATSVRLGGLELLPLLSAAVLVPPPADGSVAAGAAGSDGNPASASSPSLDTADRPTEQIATFAQCMREHGVEMPDPDGERRPADDGDADRAKADPGETACQQVQCPTAARAKPRRRAARAGPARSPSACASTASTCRTPTRRSGVSRACSSEPRSHRRADSPAFRHAAKRVQGAVRRPVTARRSAARRWAPSWLLAGSPDRVGCSLAPRPARPWRATRAAAPRCREDAQRDPST